MAKRVELVDALRGYALLGLLLVHCVERFEAYWLNPQPDIWFETTFALFGSKAFAIFALLFGFSFATIMGNERARGGDYTWRFAWRLLLLFGFGTLHTIFYRGDILQVLAAIGMLLIPADRIRSNTVLVLMAVLAFAELPLWWQAWAASEGAAWANSPPYFFSDPAFPEMAYAGFWQLAAGNLWEGSISKWSFAWTTGRFMEIIGLFFVGMVLQRTRLFSEVSEKRGTWLAVLLGAALLWSGLKLAQPVLAPAIPQSEELQMAPILRNNVIAQWQALSAMAFQVAVFVLLWHHGGRRVLRWFAPPGRMTLTLYIGQSVLTVPFLYAYGGGLYDDFSNAQMMVFGLAFFAVQIEFATLWFRHFRYGPLEWLWRVITRTSFSVQFRRLPDEQRDQI